MYVSLNSLWLSHSYRRQQSNQQWLRLWLVAWSAPSHYLNQCWDNVNWTNFNEIVIKIPIFPFKKMHFEISSEKWWPFCIGLNVLIAVDFPGLTYAQRCEPVYDPILINWKKTKQSRDGKNDFLKSLDKHSISNNSRASTLQRETIIN